MSEVPYVRDAHAFISTRGGGGGSGGGASSSCHLLFSNLFFFFLTARDHFLFGLFTVKAYRDKCSLHGVDLCFLTFTALLLLTAGVCLHEFTDQT